MSETAQTLVRSALRVIGVLAAGEVPTAAEESDGLQAMQFMFRHWSAKNIRIPYLTQNTIALTGATNYTIGSGGDCNTVRPVAIRGAFVRDSSGFDYPVDIIDESKYRALRVKSIAGTIEGLWYSPEYPLGKIYVYPTGGSTLYVDSLKPLTDPTVITSSIAFPPEYDEAIKYNLAIRLADEYGKNPSQLTVSLALSGLNDIETRNFAEQINASRLDMPGIPRKYSIYEEI